VVTPAAHQPSTPDGVTFFVVRTLAPGERARIAPHWSRPYPALDECSREDVHGLFAAVIIDRRQREPGIPLHDRYVQVVLERQQPLASRRGDLVERHLPLEGLLGQD
jgi:hypothetical protein